jgi:hypothetical protein
VLTTTASTLVTTGILQAQDAQDVRWREQCESQHEGWRARYCEVRIERLATRPELAVDGLENGGVEVLGTDGSGIVVHAMIEAEARTEEDARALASQIHIVTGNSTIRADGPTTRGRENWTVSYRIMVPRRQDLALTAVNGPLGVDQVSGRMRLDAENGPISLDRVNGDVHARGENGPLEIRLDGARWDGAGLDAETENGPVDLRIPSEYAAHLVTSTENGGLDIDFPIVVQGHFDTRRLEMDLGGGGPTIRAVTTNGPVSVKKD